MIKNEEDLPTHIEELDAAKYDKLAVQIQNCDLQKQILILQQQQLQGQWVTKYKLNGTEKINTQTREIKRADPSTNGPLRVA